jgi:hypothetical protein
MICVQKTPHDHQKTCPSVTATLEAFSHSSIPIPNSVFSNSTDYLLNFAFSATSAFTANRLSITIINHHASPVPFPCSRFRSSLLHSNLSSLLVRFSAQFALFALYLHLRPLLLRRKFCHFRLKNEIFSALFLFQNVQTGDYEIFICVEGLSAFA